MQHNKSMTRNNPIVEENVSRYARCVMTSKRISWDIEDDVIRGRALSYKEKFLPDGLSLVRELAFLGEADQRFFSQVQGRTYANMFGLSTRAFKSSL